MFTGIIQNRAKVTALDSKGGQKHFTFRFLNAEKRKLEMGESIAVNGVCLTAVNVSKQGFEADAVRETLEATTLSFLKDGDIVNTERALRHGDPLGGHFVTGHVDGVGKILKIQKNGKNLLCQFRMPDALCPFTAVKGSIVIDGISLTVQSVSGNTFAAAIVPHTWRVTNLASKKIGDAVNLEADLVARYLKRIQETGSISGSSMPKTVILKAKKSDKKTGSGKTPRKPIKIKTLRQQGF